ncbi:hypothetical protein [Halohasta salina]|uniref:hypothetical protein n=1 Tax=Halohasta salina TaxID=2961621 RepID=UPI0020A3CF8C|nr:hypothetical protein [Halohasta salina]
MKRTVLVRLMFGFGVGAVSMFVIREFLETAFELAGPPVLVQSVAIGVVVVVLVAAFQRWKPHHVLGSLGMMVVGAMIVLIILFGRMSA